MSSDRVEGTGESGVAAAPAPASPRQVAVAAAVAASDKLAEDVVVLEVGDIIGICDHFVIVSGRNSRQVKAIAEEVEEQLWLGLDRKPLATEGLDACRWVLLDYGDVVVHVFLDAERDYYRLDKLYSDAPRVDWPAESAAGVVGSLE